MIPITLSSGLSAQLIPGATNGDALPTGEYAASVTGQHLETHLGPLAFPPGETWGLHYIRITNVGGFKLVGQGHTAPGMWEYAGGKWNRYPESGGENPAIYDLQGQLHIEPVGDSRGFRQVLSNGQILLSADSAPAFHGVNKWSQIGAVSLIGQGNAMGGVVVFDGVNLLLLDATTDIEFLHLQGFDKLAVSYARKDGVVILYPTIAQLAALPLYRPPVPAPQPVPQPPAPQPVPSPQPMPTFSWNTLNIVGGSPDVRNWSETAQISAVRLSGTGISVDFDKKSVWQNVVPDGWNGGIQHTIWIVEAINGQWYATGALPLWVGDPENGGEPFAPDQVRKNWVEQASPMNGYSVTPGTTIGVFVTAGMQRAGDAHNVTERSNVVFFQWPQGPQTFTFGVTPAPTPTPVPVPVPVPQPTPQPSFDPTALLAAIADLASRVTALENKPASQTPDLSPYAKHGDAVEVSGDVTLFGLRSNNATWTGKIK